MSGRARTGLLAFAFALGVASCGDTQDHSSMGGAGAGTTMAGMDHGSTPGTQPASASTPIPESADHNGVDVLFAQEMIPHHGQAIEMADLALTRGVDPRVKSLAERVKAAQAPEIAQLRGWLSGWGQPAPADGAHDMTAMNMPSMMSPDDMAQLESRTGTAFDRTFLEQMIRHHEGAVAMARTEITGGKFGPAKAMAASIVESQSSEITEMRSILGAAP